MSNRSIYQRPKQRPKKSTNRTREKNKNHSAKIEPHTQKAHINWINSLLLWNRLDSIGFLSNGLLINVPAINNLILRHLRTNVSLLFLLIRGIANKKTDLTFIKSLGSRHYLVQLLSVDFVVRRRIASVSNKWNDKYGMLSNRLSINFS